MPRSLPSGAPGRRVQSGGWCGSVGDAVHVGQLMPSSTTRKFGLPSDWPRDTYNAGRSMLFDPPFE
jgi:hypothetical protein